MITDAPTILVIFGATGDLIARKIVPALFRLKKLGKLPSGFRAVGFARRPFTNQEYRGLLKEKTAGRIQGQSIDGFLKHFSYQQGVFDNIEDYAKLSKKITKDKANIIFYLATPPQHYEMILKNIVDSGLGNPAHEPLPKILVEKPFGRDLEEAEKIDKLLARLFKEVQIYRVDHYLAKEILQNIIAFRFANNLMEDVWSDKQIETIEIKLLEEISIEGRGEYYDSVGALLDVGQNHLLQMLALVVMDNPGEFTAKNISNARAKILENVNILDRADEIKNRTYRAQYRGYKNERGVKPGSITETYFKLKTFINLPRWKKTEVFMESGKKMPGVCKEIVVTFRHREPCLCPPDGHLKNKITFRIDPNPAISILFWSKKPGTKMELEEKVLEFKYDEAHHERYVAEYAQLLLDAFAGDQTLFISSREALAGWRFIDPVVRAWRKNATPLHKYSNEIP